MKTILTVLISSVFFVACKTQDSINETKSATKTTSETTIKMDKVLTSIEGGYPRENKAFNASDFTIEGDSLFIEVTYGGGCKEHFFQLLSNGRIKKSSPPKLDLFLQHTGEEDLCRALITERLSFDISSLKKHNGILIRVLKDQNYDVQYKLYE